MAIADTKIALELAKMCNAHKLNEVLVAFGKEPQQVKLVAANLVAEMIAAGQVTLATVLAYNTSLPVPAPAAPVAAKVPSELTAKVNEVLERADAAVKTAEAQVAGIDAVKTIIAGKVSEIDLRSEHFEGEFTKLVDEIDQKVAKIKGVDYDKIESLVRVAAADLFSTFKQTATVEALAQIAAALPPVRIVKVKDVFPRPWGYRTDEGSLIDFGNLDITLWDHPDAPEVLTDYVFNAQHLHCALLALEQKLPINLWLYGERGTGKTEFATQIAAYLGRPMYRVNFDESAERAEFIGADSVANGSAYWREGVITRAVQTPGAIVLLDELGFARAQNLAALHALCERSVHRAITIPETGRRIAVADHVVFFAADNSNGFGDASGNFAGVREHNSAFLDRFGIKLEFDYLPVDDEADLISNRTGLNGMAARMLCGFANVAREKARAGLLTQPPSLRQLFTMAELIQKGFPIGLAFKTTILSAYPAECIPELEGAFAATIDQDDLKAYLN